MKLTEIAAARRHLAALASVIDQAESERQGRLRTIEACERDLTLDEEAELNALEAKTTMFLSWAKLREDGADAYKTRLERQRIRRALDAARRATLSEIRARVGKMPGLLSKLRRLEADGLVTKIFVPGLGSLFTAVETTRFTTSTDGEVASTGGKRR